MTDRGTAALYMTDQVYGEVYRHLPKVAQWSGVPIDVLRARFEEHYLPVLRLVTVDTTHVLDPQVQAITDLDDVPTGQLAKLIAPCVVFSEDRHLRLPGLAPDDWRMIAHCAVDLVEAASRQYAAAGTVKVAGLPLYGAMELIKLVSRRTGVPTWLLGTVAAGGGALLLKDAERRRAVAKVIGPMLKAYSAEWMGATAQEQRGLAGLREVLLPAPTVPTTKQQVAIVLARQRRLLLARELQERMLVHFSRESIPTVGEVRAVLKDGLEFVQVERYRWQLGRGAGAW
jgi:hypothetical protein